MLGMAFVQALAWRQWLMKRRGWVTTLVEILSPIILVSMLVRPLLCFTLIMTAPASFDGCKFKKNQVLPEHIYMPDGHTRGEG